MTNNLDVRRIGDLDFQVTLAKDHVVQFHVKGRKRDPETSYFLVEKAAGHLLKNREVTHIRFQYGSKNGQRPNPLLKLGILSYSLSYSLPFSIAPAKILPITISISPLSVENINGRRMR